MENEGLEWDEESSNFEDSFICNKLYELELIGFPTFSYKVGVPITASEGLRKKLIASITSEWLRIRSVDYTLKRYIEGYYTHEPNQFLLKLFPILESYDYCITIAGSMLRNCESYPDTIGLLASTASLSRIHTSFKAFFILITQGFGFEAIGVLRMILEQIAWSYQVHKLIEVEQILSTSSTKSIASLKNLNQETGRIYKLLSDYTHFNPKNTRFQILSIKNNKTYVKYTYSHKNICALVRYSHKVIQIYIQVVKCVRYLDIQSSEFIEIDSAVEKAMLQIEEMCSEYSNKEDIDEIK